MKKLFAAVIALMLITVSATMAERIPFTEWLEQQTAVAEQPVVQDEPPVAEGTPLVADTESEAPLTEADSSEDTEEVLPEFEPMGMGSRGIYVEKLQEKLNQLGIPAGKVDGRFGPMTETALKTVQKALGWEETGAVETVEEWKAIATLEVGDGVNLAVGTSDEWTEWLKPGDGVNYAMGTAEAVEVAPKGDNLWCSPGDFYPTSSEGLTALANRNNYLFAVSFDWTVEGADTAVDGLICMKSSDETFSTIGKFPIDVGNSSGHFSCTFVPKDGMREHGTGWIISGIGEGNRGIRITISNFKFEQGCYPTEWSTAPEDEGDGINYAMGTAEAVEVAPKGDNLWCSPGGFYPTSSEGMTALANRNNYLFAVSFDWTVEGADTAVDGLICMKSSDETFSTIGKFPINVGDSSGHFSCAFVPKDGMREYGTGWIISGIGEGNREIRITISNFKFERGCYPTKWSIAPEDEGVGIN